MREHGTRACYVWGPEPGSVPGRGCRCEPCRQAASEAQRQARNNPTPPYVDATEVREHLAELMAAGVGLKQVTRLTGVSGGALNKILYGTPRADGTRRPPAQRVRPETRDRLLAVKASDHADGARVPAKQTWRHVETLVKRGWTRTEIGRRLGQQGPGLQLGTMYVTARHARVIRGLLDEPVPPRRTRWGVREVVQVDPEAAARDAARRAAEAERRAAYRAAARGEVAAMVPERAEWMVDGACRTAEVARWVWWAEHDRRAVAAAKQVCAACPVRAECLEYARRGGEFGVWGGTTTAEREALVAAS